MGRKGCYKNHWKVTQLSFQNWNHTDPTSRATLLNPRKRRMRNSPKRGRTMDRTVVIISCEVWAERAEGWCGIYSYRLIVMSRGLGERQTPTEAESAEETNYSNVRHQTWLWHEPVHRRPRSKTGQKMCTWLRRLLLWRKWRNMRVCMSSAILTLE